MTVQTNNYHEKGTESPHMNKHSVTAGISFFTHKSATLRLNVAIFCVLQVMNQSFHFLGKPGKVANLQVLSCLQ